MPDIDTDARRVFEALKAGGIAVFPNSMGYVITTSTSQGLEKIFQAKQRPSTKRHAMGASYRLHTTIHRLPPRHEEMVKWFTEGVDLPLAVVGKYDTEHPIFKTVEAKTLSEATVEGKIAILVNGGKLGDKISELLAAENLAFLGSSANISGTGTKFILSDVPQALLDIADVVIDYGLVKWGYTGRSSTMIDFSGDKPDVIRIGIAYETIKDHMKRFWNVELPDEPGRGALPNGGHLKNLPPLQSLEQLVAAR